MIFFTMPVIRGLMLKEAGKMKTYTIFPYTMVKILVKLSSEVT